MQTVADLKAGIRARGYATDTAAEQLIMLNAAERDILGDHRWDFMLGTATFPLVIGTAAYTLGTPVHHIEAASLVDASGGRLLFARASADEYDASLQWDTSPGQGYRWVMLRPNVVTVFPTPTITGTVSLRTIVLPTAMSSDSDVPSIPVQYRDVLVAAVCELLAMRERQPDAVSMFAAERERRLWAMKQQHGLRKAPKQVVDSGTYDHSRFDRSFQRRG